MVAVWCPDWPVTAAGHAASDPVLVVAAGRVTAASAAARARGVTVGLRRREAEHLHPNAVVVTADPARDARAFEAVVAAVADLVPAVEVARAGLLLLPARGPARYFGGEQPLRARVLDAARAAIGVAGAPPPGCGIADGALAAALAARRSAVVPAGGSRRFLAPFPVTVLGYPELVPLLHRLGIRTVGEFAELPPESVLAYFGREAAHLHTLVTGGGDQRLSPTPMSAETVAAAGFDPPVDRADQLAFAGRALADELAARLAARGTACGLLRIEADTSGGRTLCRRWSSADGLDARAMADRVRWQVDGWLAGTTRPTAPADGQRPGDGSPDGITALRLAAQQVVGAHRQLTLWGETTEADGRAARGIDRLRGMLGPDGVLAPAVRGGRDPGQRSALTPWGGPREDTSASPPWPGRFHSPAPTLVYREPVPAQVVTAAGRPVAVTGRGAPTGTPALLRTAGGRWRHVTAWAGPWPVDERWWDTGAARRLSRFQMLTADQVGYLCAAAADRWWIEAVYD